MKRVIIKRHEFVCESVRSSFYPDESLEEAFGSAGNVELIDVAHGHREAINWAWLRWHLDGQYAAIKRDLTTDVRRACDALSNGEVCDEDEERGFHDRMLMHAAILSGDQSVTESAAEHVRRASSRVRGYQYDAAVAGVLSSRVLGDSKAEKAQVEIADSQRPTGVDAYPTKDLINSFVLRDYAQFARAVTKAVEVHWSDKLLTRKPTRPNEKPVLVEEDNTQMTVDIFKKNPNFLWPYVEATFSALAMKDGAKITLDCFWFPLEFIRKLAWGTIKGDGSH